MLPADVMYSDNRPYSISTSSCSGNITGRKKKFFVFCFKEGKGERKKNQSGGMQRMCDAVEICPPIFSPTTSAGLAPAVTRRLLPPRGYGRSRVF